MKHQLAQRWRARARDCKCAAHELKRARFVTSFDSESTWLCSCVLMRAMCARATPARCARGSGRTRLMEGCAKGANASRTRKSPFRFLERSFSERSGHSFCGVVGGCMSPSPRVRLLPRQNDRCLLGAAAVTTKPEACAGLQRSVRRKLTAGLSALEVNRVVTTPPLNLSFGCCMIHR